MDERSRCSSPAARTCSPRRGRRTDYAKVWRLITEHRRQRRHDHRRRRRPPADRRVHRQPRAGTTPRRCSPSGRAPSPSPRPARPSWRRCSRTSSSTTATAPRRPAPRPATSAAAGSPATTTRPPCSTPRRSRRSRRARGARDGWPGAATSRSATTTTRRRRRARSSSATACGGCSPATSPPCSRTASIQLFGRGSMCINTGGEKVFPEEVESVVVGHPDVYDVLVVGVDDPRWGQTVAAVVAPVPGADARRRRPRGPLPGEARRRTSCPAAGSSSTGCSRSPSGKADYAWAHEVATGG